MSKRTAPVFPIPGGELAGCEKVFVLLNHTDCRAEPHMFGLHWIYVASRGEFWSPLAQVVSRNAFHAMAAAATWLINSSISTFGLWAKDSGNVLAFVRARRGRERGWSASPECRWASGTMVAAVAILSLGLT